MGSAGRRSVGHIISLAVTSINQDPKVKVYHHPAITSLHKFYEARCRTNSALKVHVGNEVHHCETKLNH